MKTRTRRLNTTSEPVTATIGKLSALTRNERRWLESYIGRLKESLGTQLKRIVIYGSKARGDAGPESDLDVLVIVENDPNGAKTARDAEATAWASTSPSDDQEVNHSVTACTEAGWLENLERELPFQRNVEAEGIQVHPVYQPAKLPPGELPPVTPTGIRNAVPIWLRTARRNLKTIKLERELIEEQELDWTGPIGRAAFDAVFFCAMAWCLTRGVSVLQRRNLAREVERHLITPGLLDASWNDRIRELSAARTDEESRPSRERRETSRQDMDRWDSSAREFHQIARRAISAWDADLKTDDDTKSKEIEDDPG